MAMNTKLALPNTTHRVQRYKFLELQLNNCSDLSRLCIQTPKPTLSPSAGFDSNFRSLANSYPPNIRQELNQYGNEYRDSMIASAKTTCRVLRYGGSNAVLTRMRTLTAYKPSASEAAKQQVAYSLAVNQYCPDAANR